MAYQLIQALEKRNSMVFCTCMKLLAKRKPNKLTIKGRRIFSPDRPTEIIVQCRNCQSEILIN